jgi:hypothetical protein
MKQVRARTFLAYFHLLNFTIMIIVTLYLLNNFWGETQDWLIAVYGYYLMGGISGAVIALWLAIDGKRLKQYSSKMEEMGNKLMAVEQKIRDIKSRTTKKEN